MKTPRLCTYAAFILLFLAPVLASGQNKITLAEAQKFGQQINTLAQQKKWTEIDKYINIDALSQLALQNMQVSEKDKKEFTEGLKEGMSEGLFTTIGAQAEDLSLMKATINKNEYRVLFRALLSGGTINYYDLIINKDKNGQIKIDDIYTYTSVDYMSNLIGSVILAAFPEGFGDGGDKNSDKMFKLLKSMTKAKKEGDFSRVLDLYSQLPDEYKKQKMFLTIRLTAAQNINNEEYKTALTDFGKYYPDEPGLSLMMIDRYFLEGDFDKALEAINKTDSIVGGDPYLELYRGNLYTQTGEYDKAELSLQKFVSAFPKNTLAYPTYVSLLIVNEKYALAVETLKKWKRETGQNPLEYISVDDYPEFAESAEYQEYLKQK